MTEDVRCLSMCEIAPGVPKRCCLPVGHKESHMWVESFDRIGGYPQIFKWSGADASRPDEVGDVHVYRRDMDVRIDRCPYCGEQVTGITAEIDNDGPMPLLSLDRRVETRMKNTTIPCGHVVTTEALVDFDIIDLERRKPFHRLALYRIEDRPSWP